MTTTCQRPHCTELAVCECDCCPSNCQKGFCDDHGSPGRDTDNGDGTAAYAVASQCWACGGFDGWEGMSDAEIVEFLKEVPE